MNPTRSHYEMLGVAPDADAAAIKAAYRKLVRTMHPDGGGNSAVFGLITEAIECLGDPTKRAEYDRHLAAGGEGAARAAEEALAAAARQEFLRKMAETAARIEAAQARAEGARAEAADPWAAEAARLDHLAAESDSRHRSQMAAIDAEYAARRARHPLRLWLPMTAAVLLGVAASYPLEHFSNTDGLFQGAVFTLGMVFRAACMVLFGGFLIAHRNAMARLCARDAAAICLAWALVAALGDHLFYGSKVLLPTAVFLAVIVTGVRARGGWDARLPRTPWTAVKEALLCARAAVRAAIWVALAIIFR